MNDNEAIVRIAALIAGVLILVTLCFAINAAQSDRLKFEYYNACLEKGLVPTTDSDRFQVLTCSKPK